MTFSTTTLVLLLATASMAASAQSVPQGGKDIYERMCAGCHGTHGDGAEGHSGGFSPVVTTLANKAYMKQVTDEYLVMIIKKGGAAMGKIATMPAWEKRLSEEDIVSIVAHIRTF